MLSEIADKVAVMQIGAQIKNGSAYEIFSSPCTPTTQRFVGSVLRRRPDVHSLNAIGKLSSGALVEVKLLDQLANDPVLSRIARAHGGN